ncbi:hypothetical protein GINT2_001711 [Glugoides intestinalis]
MRRLVLIKGSHRIEKVIEIGNKAHVVTQHGTFKIRDNLHSNSFIALINNGFSQVQRIYELTPVRKRDIYDLLPFSTITDLQFIQVEISPDEIKQVAKEYYVLQEGGRLAKLAYGETVRILCYLQTLETRKDFCLFGRDKPELKEIILETFTGTSVELGFFILLDCLQNNRLDNFMLEWRSTDLFEVDLEALKVFIEDSFLEKAEKSKLKPFLSKIMLK